MKGGVYLELVGKKIGFVLTGSFCTFKKTIPKIKELVEKEKADIIPIMSYNSYKLDTKFGKAKDFILEIEEITGKKIVYVRVLAFIKNRLRCKNCQRTKDNV